jgi:predicted lipoprotein with Yx(FWY)xxD motif
MIRTRLAMGAALCAAAAFAVTACGAGSTPAAGPAKAAPASVRYTSGTAISHNAATDTGDFAKGATSSPAAMKWVQLSSAAVGALNPVVVNGAGFTLYRFDEDTPNPSKSNCNGACAVTWPPVLVQPGGQIFLNGVPKSAVGVVRRADGNLQVTIGGWPVYKFSKDTAPGQTNGQGVGGTWFGVTPEGQKAGPSAQGTSSTTGLDYQNGTAAQNNAPANTGDLAKGASSSPAAMKWVQLSSAAVGALNPVIVNGAGFTLYRFDEDTPNPSKSNCNGACAVTWPPVLVRPGSKIFLNGVPQSAVGVVRRADGTLQVTIGGWPVYKFSKDTAAGQANGEGVGGTWFGVSPEGAKVLPIAGSSGT